MMMLAGQALVGEWGKAEGGTRKIERGWMNASEGILKKGWMYGSAAVLCE
jgi:hypothetical protein